MALKFPHRDVHIFGNIVRLGEVKASPRKRFLFLLASFTPGNILFGDRGEMTVEFLVV